MFIPKQTSFYTTIQLHNTYATVLIVSTYTHNFCLFSHIDNCCLCAILFLDYCIQIIYKTGMLYLLSITKVFAIPYTPTPWRIVVSVTKAVSLSKHNKNGNIIIMCTITCALLFQFHAVDTILNLNSDMNNRWVAEPSCCNIPSSLKFWICVQQVSNTYGFLNYHHGMRQMGICCRCKTQSSITPVPQRINKWKGIVFHGLE